MIQELGAACVSQDFLIALVYFGTITGSDLWRQGMWFLTGLLFCLELGGGHKGVALET